MGETALHHVGASSATIVHSLACCSSDLMLSIRSCASSCSRWAMRSATAPPQVAPLLLRPSIPGALALAPPALSRQSGLPGAVPGALAMGFDLTRGPQSCPRPSKEQSSMGPLGWQ